MAAYLVVYFQIIRNERSNANAQKRLGLWYNVGTFVRTVSVKVFIVFSNYEMNIIAVWEGGRISAETRRRRVAAVELMMMMKIWKVHKAILLLGQFLLFYFFSCCYFMRTKIMVQRSKIITNNIRVLLLGAEKLFLVSIRHMLRILNVIIVDGVWWIRLMMYDRWYDTFWTKLFANILCCWKYYNRSVLFIAYVINNIILSICVQIKNLNK